MEMVDDPESNADSPITTSTSPVITTPTPTPTPTSSTLTSTQPYRTSRPSIVGPPSPLYLGSPYPIRLRGKVCRGFGRGGKDLGCPTANLPDENDDANDRMVTGVQAMKGKVDTGVFYGFAKVLSSTKSNSNSNATSASVVSDSVHPMVMSLGWNPFYKNERLTAEIHVMYDYGVDFYGLDIKVLVLGYVRPELDYLNQEALIEDINTDKRVALNSLARPDYAVFHRDSFFFEDDEDEEEVKGKGEGKGEDGVGEKKEIDV
ncbi:hypothetical protein F5890DRAFT_1470022 [Lentinula detonsa]|uniref:Riboflavin kinase n=1 Tax=Lentinula detonsa TaxID=2804962 RepID=A0AA38UXH8_9AGAR|nr:hypothetical protein F5890DRAFT_1470022 [Lentinula detonsa]